jgi:hypothetical protein
LATMCKSESLVGDHAFDLMLFKHTCWLQVSTLSKRFLNRLEMLSPGMHTVLELRDEIWKVSGQQLDI